MAQLFQCDMCGATVKERERFGLDVAVRLPGRGRRAQFGALAGHEIAGGEIRRSADICPECAGKLDFLRDLLPEEERAQLPPAPDQAERIEKLERELGIGAEPVEPVAAE